MGASLAAEAGGDARNRSGDALGECWVARAYEINPATSSGQPPRVQRPLSPNWVREYATNVTGMVIPNSGHWLYQEHPAELTRILLQFLR